VRKDYEPGVLAPSQKSASELGMLRRPLGHHLTWAGKRACLPGWAYHVLPDVIGRPGRAASPPSRPGPGHGITLGSHTSRRQQGNAVAPTKAW
jgi:hypothetical protein